MNKLSQTEAYFISTLRLLQSPKDMEPLINLLLGLYACHLLDHFETKKRENILLDMQKTQEDNFFFLLINRLKALGFIEVEKKTSFSHLMIDRITIKNEEKILIENPQLKKILSHFRKKIRSSFENIEKKKSKYEVRFFWPSSVDPEVYDIQNFIFKQEEYTYKLTNDRYIIGSNKFNIKMREGELHVKECIENIDSMFLFKKKKNIKFPLEKKILEKFLQKKLSKYPTLLETPEDLLIKRPGSSEISCIEVLKERYVRKMADHTKIEIALIKTQGRAWKTICIESHTFETVLALSLLINPKNAEKLSYNEFFQREI